jgi:hypothetical protein
MKPHIPEPFYYRWWGVIYRLEALKELDAPLEDIKVARRERNAIATEVCDYYLAHWETLTPKEQDVALAMMQRLPLDEELARR